MNNDRVLGLGTLRFKNFDKLLGSNWLHFHVTREREDLEVSKVTIFLSVDFWSMTHW